MASPTDVTTAAAADDPDTGLRAPRALRGPAGPPGPGRGGRRGAARPGRPPGGAAGAQPAGTWLVLAADRRRPGRDPAGRPQEARHLAKGPLTCSNASPPRPAPRASGPGRGAAPAGPPTRSPPPREGTVAVSERFAAEARTAVVEAQQEARDLRASRIEPVHPLLAPSRDLGRGGGAGRARG